MPYTIAVKASGVKLTENSPNVQPIILEFPWDELKLPFDMFHVLGTWRGEMVVVGKALFSNHFETV